MESTQTKIKKLLAIKIEKYRKRGDCNPEIAGQFAVENILSIYKTQMDSIDILLEWEIEDAIKAA